MRSNQRAGYSGIMYPTLSLSSSVNQTRPSGPMMILCWTASRVDSGNVVRVPSGAIR